jgi:septal ring factor EnvC (AmiA/AmiB activator)
MPKIAESTASSGALEQEWGRLRHEIERIDALLVASRQEVASRDKAISELRDRLEEEQQAHVSELGKRKSEHQQIIETFNNGMAKLRDE